MALIRNVHVSGHGWWGPAYDPEPPPEVAALITNPLAWDGGRRPAVEAPAANPTPTPTPPPLSPLEALATLPDDRDVLGAFAADHGIEFDARLGVARRRAVIASALRERGQ